MYQKKSQSDLQFKSEEVGKTYCEGINFLKKNWKGQKKYLVRILKHFHSNQTELRSILNLFNLK